MELYYRYSPPAAAWLEGHSTVKPIVRILLLPLIGFAWLLLEAGVAVQISAVLLLITLTVVWSWRSRRRTSIA